MLNHTESNIVLDAQAGNTDAFEQLVVRYQNMITSLAFSQTGDLQRSEDIAQQAFLTAWEKRKELEDPRRFGGWLRSITRNLTRNSNRKSQLLDRSAPGLESHQEPTIDDEPQQFVATSEQQQLLWASLKNIPEEYREPLVLFYREDKSIAQVAELMDLSVDAVKQRLSRGRKMLKAEVEQFVESLLGASKPTASFASAIMVAIPAPTIKAIVQSGTAVGAKTVLGKIGLLASGPLLGAIGGILGAAGGIAGGYWGTRNSVQYATSEDERRLLWKFFWGITIESLLFTVVMLLITFQTRGALLLGTGLCATFAFTGLIIFQVWNLVRKQNQLHAIHGKPEYPQMTGGDGKPASVTQFRFSIFGATIGCWTWLIVMSAIQLNWIVLAATIAVMGCLLGWRMLTAHVPQTLAEQLRFQASGAIVNVFWAALIVMVGGFFGLQYKQFPNWLLAVMVLLIGWFCAAMLWHGANRAERGREVRS